MKIIKITSFPPISIYCDCALLEETEPGLHVARFFFSAPSGCPRGNRRWYDGGVRGRVGAVFFCYLLKLSCLWLRYLLQDQIIGRGGGEIIASMDNRSWAMKSLSLIQITLLILGVVAIGSLSTRFTMQTVMSDGFANFIQMKGMQQAVEIRKQLREIAQKLNYEFKSCGKESTPIR